VTALYDTDYLTPAQIDLLMRELHGSRVLSLDGNSYLAQWDVRAMLTRVFGFARWSDEGIYTKMLYELETTTRPKGDQPGKPAFKVGYVAARRLTVYSPAGTMLAVYEGTSACDQTMPDFKRADAHDFAIKTAESSALKRAAINLGTQFGLGLYGGTTNEVVRVLAHDPRPRDRSRPAFVNPEDGTAADDPIEVTHDDDMVKRDGEDDAATGNGYA